MRFGLQLHLPTFGDLSVTELTTMVGRAKDGGIEQVWVTDNLGARHPFVVLAAIATKVPIDIGTAVMVQYLRSPLEAASAIATVNEMLEGRRLDIALGAGNPFTSSIIYRPRPVAFMKETALCLRAALTGETVNLDSYPLLQEYFRLASGASCRMDVRAGASVGIHGGANGPLGLSLAGSHLDGVVIGWTFLPAMRIGKLSQMTEVVAHAAANAGRSDVVRKVGEVKVAVTSTHREARDWVRSKKESVGMRCVSLRRRGYSNEDFVGLEIDPGVVDALERDLTESGNLRATQHLVTETMVESCFIAGDVAYCQEKLSSVIDKAQSLQFDQIVFSELGPNPTQSLDLLLDHLLPAYLGGR